MKDGFRLMVLLMVLPSLHKERMYALLSNIMVKVAILVHEEKSPMKEEYSFGLGYCAFNFDFQVTSTKLMLIPYATTKVARSLTYLEVNRNLKLTIIPLFCFEGTYQFGRCCR